MYLKYRSYEFLMYFSYILQPKQTIIKIRFIKEKIFYIGLKKKKSLKNQKF